MSIGLSGELNELYVPRTAYRNLSAGEQYGSGHSNMRCSSPFFRSGPAVHTARREWLGLLCPFPSTLHYHRSLLQSLYFSTRSTRAPHATSISQAKQGRQDNDEGGEKPVVIALLFPPALRFFPDLRLTTCADRLLRTLAVDETEKVDSTNVIQQSSSTTMHEKLHSKKCGMKGCSRVRDEVASLLEAIYIALKQQWNCYPSINVYAQHTRRRHVLLLSFARDELACLQCAALH